MQGAPERTRSGIDALAERPIPSESVYLDCVTPDASAGFVLRLCRYPENDTSWLWLHVFHPGSVLAYNDHYLPCPGGATPEAAHATYALTGLPRVEITRDGASDAVRDVRAIATVAAHRDPHAPYGPGDVPLRVEARLRPRQRLGGTLAGRFEVHGGVQTRISLEDRELEIAGLGQWHEQFQEAPRFRVPFTYASLRGPEVSFVGLASAGRARGLLWRSAATRRVQELEISPRALTRSLRLVDASGQRLRGEVFVSHDYSVPIYAGRRPGTLVSGTLAGQPVSGCVNDWDPPHAGD